MPELRKRVKSEISKPDGGAGISAKESSHPAGPIKHGGFKQFLLISAFIGFTAVSCMSTHVIQLLGCPLYFINRDYYYALMSITKQFFGLVLNCVTSWYSPTTVRVSGDSSVKGQLKITKDGRLETTFPERLIMMANHQIYTDWLYLWWISYTGLMHGHIYIILKESLKYIPILGTGMVFFSFIFLARNWTKDKPRFQHRLQKLKGRHQGPLSGSQSLDPMWLLIFPEGTNMSKNGREGSRKWAAKAGLEDMRHTLLPRTTGLHFCLQELEGTVEWIYDCTIAYEGIPDGEYGQDIYTLRSIYFQGRYPRSVNMYWRRFRIESIPYRDSKAFDLWLRDRWNEKDELIEQYQQTGRFPADESGGAGKSGYIETEVKSRRRFEFLIIYTPFLSILAVLLCFCALARSFGP